MIALKINQNIFAVKEGISILEACQYVGIKIPRFCYHETLSISGNCRMCLVKLEFDDKLIISCLTEVVANMEIISNDPVINKAREEIIEFLLLNHPLDCPICDQGGECDLQDQSKLFGSNLNKSNINKTSVEDKIFGVFIKSIMTRCIHCTRCVRFSTEIVGSPFFGTLNRGGLTEIGTYSPNFFDSEISGNVIDLCPVGALTSKSYTFKARPWELKSIETIDLTDSVGSNVYVNFNNSSILRVLPKLNSEINENLISDKARFSFDSHFSHNRLNNALDYKVNEITCNENSKTLLKALKDLVLKNKSLILISDDLNFECLNFLKKLCVIYPNTKVRAINKNFNKSNLFLNSTSYLKEIKANVSSTIFLFCLNPRTEAALINSRIRFLSFNNYITIYSFGYKFDSLLKNSFLNISLDALILFSEGKLKHISNALINSINSIVFLGPSLKERGFCTSFFKTFLQKISPSILFFEILNKSNSSGSRYLNFKSASTNDFLNSGTTIILNCRETSFLKKNFLKTNSKYFFFNTFISNFSLINNSQLPIKNIYEDTGVYFNLEFRPQISRKIVDNSINAFSLLKILNHVFVIKNTLSKHNNFIKEYLKNPDLFLINSEKVYLILINTESKYFLEQLKLINFPLKPQIVDFFRTSCFTDYSKNMLIASQEFQKKNNNFF